MCFLRLAREYASTSPCNIQIEELVDYLARGYPEEEREIFIASFRDVLKTKKLEGDNEEPVELSEEEISRRRNVVSMVITNVKGFGDGSEKGMYDVLTLPALL
jgi:translation initiation factor 3 subunit M